MRYVTTILINEYDDDDNNALPTISLHTNHYTINKI